ncbi:MBL fold metallo-hydrolase [Jiella sp. M17.18]|uniref:MBL fold metallo-hydrolase n=1 Tax=Jiella sp. M17.18 TaxID=3234247 RepID=UPI0034DEDFEE
MSRFEATIWGARGSISAPAQPNCVFGSDTSCVEVRCGERTLILDAGTGIVGCGRHLYETHVQEIDILLTHCHFDHIMGLPFVIPLYKDHVSARIFAGHFEDATTTRSMVEGFMCPPYFPVTPKQFAAKIDYRDFRPPDILDLGDGIVVKTVRLTHPNGAVGYRIDYDGHSLCYITDTEHVPGTLDPGILDLIAGADAMIYDSMYTDETFGRYIGFGHSTWQQGVRLCRAGQVARLIIFHHDVTQTDDRLEALEATARGAFAGASVARTGLTISIGEGDQPA